MIISFYYNTTLLCFCSNPSLRVAYIDEVEEMDGGKSQKVYYSVLIKAVDNLDQANIFLVLHKILVNNIYSTRRLI